MLEKWIRESDTASIKLPGKSDRFTVSRIGHAVTSMQTNQITPSTPFSSIVAVVVALLFALILYYTRGMVSMFSSPSCVILIRFRLQKSTKFTNLKKMSDETTAQFCSVTGAQCVPMIFEIYMYSHTAFQSQRCQAVPRQIQASRRGVGCLL